MLEIEGSESSARVGCREIGALLDLDLVKFQDCRGSDDCRGRTTVGGRTSVSCYLVKILLVLLQFSDS